MSDLIKTDTLIDISRHSNKAIKISKFMEGAESRFLVDKMTYIDSESSSLDLMTAIFDDLSTTSNIVKSLALIVESSNDEHKALELKNDENDLSVLFPNNYNKDNGVLDLFGVEISKANKISKVSARVRRENVYNHVFAEIKDKFSYDDFSKHLLNLKTMENDGKPKREDSLDKAIQYSQRVASTERWGEFYDEVMKLSNNYNEFFKRLPAEARNVVDEKIITGKASILGVVKTSTYITKQGGIDQLSSKHKKDEGLINDVLKLFNETPCLRAVELDRDASLEKLHDMLVFVKGLNLDAGKSFEIKVRKMGNLRFSGVYISTNENSESIALDEIGIASKEFRIVGLDVDSPVSLAHELGHLNDDESDPLRNSIVGHFSQKMNPEILGELLTPNKVSYLTNKREVFARVAEIGFTLNELGYQNGETAPELLKRINAPGNDKPKDGARYYDLAVSKSLETYLSEYNAIGREMYFNLAKWSPDELSLMRDFAHNIYYSPDEDLRQKVEQRIKDGELNQLSKNYYDRYERTKSRVVRRSEADLVKKAYSNLVESEIASTYKAGVKEGVFEDGEFITNLSEYLFDVCSNTKIEEKVPGKDGLTKTRKIRNGELWRVQINAVSNLINAIDPNERPVDAMFMREIANGMARTSRAMGVFAKLNDVEVPFPRDIAQQSFLREIVRQGARTESFLKWGGESPANVGDRVFDLGSKTFYYKLDVNSTDYNAYKNNFEKNGGRIDFMLKIFDLKTRADERFSDLEFSPEKLRDATPEGKFAWAIRELSPVMSRDLSPELLSISNQKSVVDNLVSTFNIDFKEMERQVAYVNKTASGDLDSLSSFESSLYSDDILNYEELAKTFVNKHDIDRSAVLFVMDNLADLEPVRRGESSWSKWEYNDSESVQKNVESLLVELSNHPARSALDYKDQNRRSEEMVDKDVEVNNTFGVQPAPTPLAALVNMAVRCSQLPRSRTEIVNDIKEVLLSNVTPTHNFELRADRTASMLRAIVDGGHAHINNGSKNTPFIKTMTDMLVSKQDSLLKNVLLSQMANWMMEEGLALTRKKNVVVDSHYAVYNIPEGETINRVNNENVDNLFRTTLDGMEVLVNSARGSEFEFSESHHYHLVDDEFTDFIKSFEEKLAKIGEYAPDVLPSLLQGLTSFTHPDFSLNKKGVKPGVGINANPAILETEKALKNSAVYLLDKGIAYRNVKPFIEKHLTVSGVENVVDNAPVIAEPSPSDLRYTPQVTVEKPNETPDGVEGMSKSDEVKMRLSERLSSLRTSSLEDLKPSDNNNVPPANGKMLRKENQFKLL